MVRHGHLFAIVFSGAVCHGTSFSFKSFTKPAIVCPSLVS